MKMEFNWVKDIKVSEIETIIPKDPTKKFRQRKIFIETGKEFYTIIVNGTYENNLEIQIIKSDDIEDKPSQKEKTSKKT